MHVPVLVLVLKLELGLELQLVGWWVKAALMIELMLQLSSRPGQPPPSTASAYAPTSAHAEPLRQPLMAHPKQPLMAHLRQPLMAHLRLHAAAASTPMPMLHLSLRARLQRRPCRSLHRQLHQRLPALACHLLLLA